MAELPKYTLGLDLGGTTWKINILEGFSPLIRRTFQIPSLVDDGPQRALEALKAGVESALQELGLKLSEIEIVGLASPGPATEDGVLFASGNLRHPKWLNFALRAAIEKLFEKPTYYTNDCNAAARGEFSTLKSPEHDLLFLAPGTGLGGGAVIKGRVVGGTSGAAMEIGHLQMPLTTIANAGIDNVPQCRCGRDYCYESIVSMHGLAFQLDYALRQIRASRTKRNQWHRFRKSSVLELSGDILDRAKQLLTLAGQGDDLALELFRQQANVLGSLIGELTIVFDQDRVRIGGGLADSPLRFRQMYLSEVEDSMVRRIFKHQVENLAQKKTKVEFAKLGARAGAIGAALYAIDLHTHPEIRRRTRRVVRVSHAN